MLFFVGLDYDAGAPAESCSGRSLPKGQKHTISKSGHHHLATMIRIATTVTGGPLLGRRRRRLPLHRRPREAGGGGDGAGAQLREVHMRRIAKKETKGKKVA